MQFIAELAADHRADLGDFLAQRDPVEAGHQRVAQRLRDRDVGRRSGIGIMVALDDQVAGLQDGLGQFLDEERNAVGPGDDLGGEARRQRLAADDIGDQRAALRRREFREIHHGDGGVVCPWRVEFGPRGDDQQRRDAGQVTSTEAREQVERTSGRPSARPRTGAASVPCAPAARTKSIRTRIVSSLASFGETENRAVALLVGNRKQRRDEAHVVPGKAEPVDDERFQPVEPGSASHLAAAGQRALERGPDRIKGAVDEERRALEHQSLARFVLRGARAARSTIRLLPMPASPRSRIARPTPVSCTCRQRPSSAEISASRPTIGVRLALRRRFEAAFGLADAEHAIDPGRPADALQLLLAEVLIFEFAARHPAHAVAHDDRTGLGDGLKAGRQDSWSRRPRCARRRRPRPCPR